MEKIPVISGIDDSQRRSGGDGASGLAQAGMQRTLSAKAGKGWSIGLPDLLSFYPILTNRMTPQSTDETSKDDLLRGSRPPGALEDMHGNELQKQGTDGKKREARKAFYEDIEQSLKGCDRSMEFAMEGRETAFVKGLRNEVNLSVIERPNDLPGSLEGTYEQKGIFGDTMGENRPVSLESGFDGVFSDKLRKTSLSDGHQSGKTQLLEVAMNRTKMIEPAGGMDGMERQAPPVESPSIAGTAASKNGAVTDGRMDDQAHPYLRLFSEAMTTGTENRKDLLVERLAGLVNDRDKSSEKTSGTSIQIRDAVKVAAPNDKIPLVDLQELPRASVEERPATLRTTVLQGADGSRERIDAVLIGNGAGFGTGQGEENRNMSMQDEANDWTGSTESEGMKSFYRSAVNGSGTEGTQATSENLRSMDLLSQIQEARSILMRDFGRVRIALNPPSLGNLDLEIMVRRNRVEVVIRVDNLLVQQTLQANADELKTSLQGQGLHIEGLSILNSGTADRQDYAFSNNGSLQRDDQDWRNAGRNDGEEEEAPLSPFMERSPGRYDSSSGTISLFV